ncbi:MAG: hypothetical protein ACREFH_10625 [Stellaceae bacterium]
MSTRFFFVLLSLLLLAGCSAGGGTASDKDKQGQFYGGLSGGWTHP